MNDMQKAAANPVLDGPARDPERTQLPGGHDAMLPLGNPSDHEVHMDNCRIDVLFRDLRQYRMTYLQL